MAFTVEDGTGLANANAYVSLAAFKAYHDDRGGSYVAYTDDQIQEAIVRATDFMDQKYRYVGGRYSSGQSLEWPRRDAVDSSGFLLSGVPTKVANACAELAMRALAGSLLPDPDYNSTGRLIEYSDKMGPMAESFKYDRGAVPLPSYPAADRLLAGLIESTDRIYRA